MENNSISSIDNSQNEAKKVIELLDEMPKELVSDKLMVLCSKTIKRHLSYQFTNDGLCGVNIVETVRKWAPGDKESHSESIDDYSISASFYMYSGRKVKLTEDKYFRSFDELYNWLWPCIYCALYSGKKGSKAYARILNKFKVKGTLELR